MVRNGPAAVAAQLNFAKTSSPKTRGAAAVEFAVLAPFLIFLMLGMFEIGQGIMVKSVLSDAARIACRTGITPGKANSDVTAEVNDILTANGIPASDATITILVNGNNADVSTANRTDKISVKVAVPISDVYWFSTYFLTGQTVESETVSMMRQG
jgi:Flp pilus assembly protein TadG